MKLNMLKTVFLVINLIVWINSIGLVLMGVTVFGSGYGSHYYSQIIYGDFITPDIERVYGQEISSLNESPESFIVSQRSPQVIYKSKYKKSTPYETDGLRNSTSEELTEHIQNENIILNTSPRIKTGPEIKSSSIIKENDPTIRKKRNSKDQRQEGNSEIPELKRIRKKREEILEDYDVPLSTYPTMAPGMIIAAEQGITLIITGTVLILAALMGAMLGIQTPGYLLLVYGLILGIGAVVSSVVGGWILVYPTNWGHTIDSQQTVLRLAKLRLQKLYGSEQFQVYTNAIDYVQSHLKCCGINGSEDYLTSDWFLSASNSPNLLNSGSQTFQTAGGIPPSCLSNKACSPLVQHWLEDDSFQIGLLLLLSSFILTIGSVAGITLKHHSPVNTQCNFPKIESLLF